MPITGAMIGHILDLSRARGGQIESLDDLAAGCNHALQVAKVIDPRQAAAFLATQMFESAYFRTSSEYLASPGTSLRSNQNRYYPYIGRTFDQITWEENYAEMGAWAAKYRVNGVTDPKIFVKAPTLLGTAPWYWLGGVWFWGAKGLWWVSKTGDFARVTQIVNGGTSGLSARTVIYNALLKYGNQLLPPSTAPKAPVSIPVLHLGSTGVHVTNLQNGLNRIFPAYRSTPIATDGKFGTHTQAAVKEFQQRAGHLTVDGIVGPMTRSRLASYRIII